MRLVFEEYNRLAQYTFTLETIPPFRLDYTVWILRRRPDNQIDRWDGKAYHRILVLENNPIKVTVTQIGPPEVPHLAVLLNGTGAGPDVEARVTLSLERLLGIRVDLKEFYQFAESRVNLNDLADQFRGSKPPRFPVPFEALLNAITCQQLSLTVGIRLLNRLSQAYGPAFQEESTFHAFPRPEDLVDIDVEELRKIGYSYQKGRYMVNLSKAIVNRQINLDEIETFEDKSAIEQLCEIKGVGRWTAEYFLLRGLGRTHIFPGDDVGARNHLQRWLGLPERMDYLAVHRALSGSEKYGGLIYFHLLLKSLLEKGIICD
ncbi:MAG: DNA-3-methyladenine glycosylase 2 family protein [Anaerolineaceae bacterium]|nr:DNA-3-methyladenine glycosylase 2 family protein [Anaerolineaceae bacterium]